MQRGLGFGNPPRARLGAADPDPRLGNHAVGDPICHQRRHDGEIAGTPVEFDEAEAGLICDDRQAHRGEDFILRQRGGHDALEEVVRRNHALSALAGRDADHHDVGIEFAHAHCQILRTFQPRQQAIAGRRQPGLDDFGAGGVVVDQQDGQGLGHAPRGATSMPPSRCLLLGR